MSEIPGQFRTFESDNFRVINTEASWPMRLFMFFVLWPLLIVGITFAVFALLIAAWPFMLTEKFYVTKPNRFSAR